MYLRRLLALAIVAVPLLFIRKWPSSVSWAVFW